MSVPDYWDDPDRRDYALKRVQASIDHANEMWPGAKLSTRERSDELTEFELQMLRAFSHGLGRSGTAAILGVDLEKVKNALIRVRRKLCAKDTTHACSEALRRGLIQ